MSSVPNGAVRPGLKTTRIPSPSPNSPRRGRSPSSPRMPTDPDLPSHIPSPRGVPVAFGVDEDRGIEQVLQKSERAAAAAAAARAAASPNGKPAKPRPAANGTLANGAATRGRNTTPKTVTASRPKTAAAGTGARAPSAGRVGPRPASAGAQPVGPPAGQVTPRKGEANGAVTPRRYQSPQQRRPAREPSAGLSYNGFVPPELNTVFEQYSEWAETHRCYTLTQYKFVQLLREAKVMEPISKTEAEILFIRAARSQRTQSDVRMSFSQFCAALNHLAATRFPGEEIPLQQLVKAIASDSPHLVRSMTMDGECPLKDESIAAYVDRRRWALTHIFTHYCELGRASGYMNLNSRTSWRDVDKTVNRLKLQEFTLFLTEFSIMPECLNRVEATKLFRQVAAARNKKGDMRLEFLGFTGFLDVLSRLAVMVTLDAVEGDGKEPVSALEKVEGLMEHIASSPAIGRVEHSLGWAVGSVSRNFHTGKPAASPVNGDTLDKMVKGVSTYKDGHQHHPRARATPSPEPFVELRGTEWENGLRSDQAAPGTPARQSRQTPVKTPSFVERLAKSQPAPPAATRHPKPVYPEVTPDVKQPRGASPVASPRGQPSDDEQSPPRMMRSSPPKSNANRRIEQPGAGRTALATSAPAAVASSPRTNARSLSPRQGHGARSKSPQSTPGRGASSPPSARTPRREEAEDARGAGSEGGGGGRSVPSFVDRLSQPFERHRSPTPTRKNFLKRSSGPGPFRNGGAEVKSPPAAQSESAASTPRDRAGKPPVSSNVTSPRPARSPATPSASSSARKQSPVGSARQASPSPRRKDSPSSGRSRTARGALKTTPGSRMRVEQVSPPRGSSQSPPRAGETTPAAMTSRSVSPTPSEGSLRHVALHNQALGRAASPTRGRSSSPVPSLAARSAHNLSPKMRPASPFMDAVARVVSPEKRRRLKDIYIEYCTIGDPLAAHLMSFSKFLRFCRDTRMLSNAFTATDVDVLFLRCGGGGGDRRIDYEGFRLAILQLAEMKYPDNDEDTGINRLLEDFVHKFAQNSLQGAEEEDEVAEKVLQPYALRLLKEQKWALTHIFSYYCVLDVSRPAVPWDEIARLNKEVSLHEFMKFCYDFAVVPRLVGHADAAIAFRGANSSPNADEQEDALCYPEFTECLARVATLAFPDKPGKKEVALHRKMIRLFVSMGNSDGVNPVTVTRGLALGRLRRSLINAGQYPGTFDNMEGEELDGFELDNDDLGQLTEEQFAAVEAFVNRLVSMLDECDALKFVSAHAVGILAKILTLDIGDRRFYDQARTPRSFEPNSDNGIIATQLAEVLLDPGHPFKSKKGRHRAIGLVEKVLVQALIDQTLDRKASVLLIEAVRRLIRGAGMGANYEAWMDLPSDEEDENPFAGIADQLQEAIAADGGPARFVADWEAGREEYARSSADALRARAELVEQRRRIEAVEQQRLRQKWAAECENDKKMKPLLERRRRLVANIPGFWRTVLYANPETRAALSGDDLTPLTYLQDISVVRRWAELKIHIVFTFGKNPFFTNRKLTKAFSIDYKKSDVAASTCRIQWRPRKDVTLQSVPSSKPGRRTREVKTNSFFRFFGECDPDMQLAEDLVEEIVPNAIYWYRLATGESLEDPVGLGGGAGGQERPAGGAGSPSEGMTEATEDDDATTLAGPVRRWVEACRGSSSWPGPAALGDGPDGLSRGEQLAVEFIADESNWRRDFGGAEEAAAWAGEAFVLHAGETHPEEDLGGWADHIGEFAGWWYGQGRGGEVAPAE